METTGRLGLTRPRVYCCDSDALINLQDAALTTKLRRMARENRLRVPEGVKRELSRRTDKLRQTLATWETKYPSVVAALDAQSMGLLHDLENKYGPPFSIGAKTYGGFWNSRAGRKAVDSHLVALGKVHGWTVVSNDDSVHGACMKENVECHRWEELGRILCWGIQPSLFP